MKEKDNKLDFVLHYYQEGKLNTQEAIRQLVLARQQRPLRRWVAAAASLLAVVAIAATLTLWPSAPSASHEQPNSSTQEFPHSGMSGETLHFDNTPLPEVLQTLGDFYGAELEASDTTKHMTGDLDTLSLEKNIEIIEQVLGVSIEVKSKR